MKMLYFLLALLYYGFALEILVHAQNHDQSGFISLDCGLPINSNYVEKTTQINYISDADFITTGTNHSVAEEYKNGNQEQVKTLRSFPEGIRNCYKVNVAAKTRYLIRAFFLHGNYDGQNTAPEFDLHIGGNYWDTVRVSNVSLSSFKEVIHTPSQNRVSICLVNTGLGTPFISALEFRPMSDLVYYNNTRSVESLSLIYRLDIGSTTSFPYRFPNDVIDRAWLPYFFRLWTQIGTKETIDANSTAKYRPPSIVMSTMATPLDESQPMQMYFEALNTFSTYYYYMHFAELQQLKANELRAFNISINRDVVYENLSPNYLRTTTIFNPIGLSGSTNYTFSLDKLPNSTLPPILNAVELFMGLDLTQSETEENDVDAINNIKSSYGVNKINWDGDPCVPKAYLWTGLNCSYDIVDPPRIISLDLSSSGLSGEISTHISKLSAIETLDLSNNNLIGPVPDFLSQLPNLRVLNLERNNLSGSIPIGLVEKVNSGALSLSVEENMNLCPLSECNENKNAKKKNNTLIPIIASVGGLVVLLIIATAILVALKKKKKEYKLQNEPFQSIKRRYTFAEVERITNNFESVIGKGGFGEVFHGFIDENTQVAVKILSSSSKQGYTEFQSEVNLLMKVYHGNLTNLIGYCYEESNMAVIYEYMANGDLGSHLSGDSNDIILSWEGRLQIAIDAAQGLEYLHNGCKPPIIHRDIKCANILLTKNFRAKLADFGLSKTFAADNDTHVYTVVAGTPGYLDPTYRETGRLNEKSDIYSFGVVILEIITSRPRLIATRQDPDEKVHISQWIGSLISSGVITNVVDPRLQGDFDTNSIWKAVEVGMACASQAPARRPNMNEVVRELKECLAMELARKNQSRESTSDYSEMSSNVTTEFHSLAR